jgi:hypothetical protein
VPFSLELAGEDHVRQIDTEEDEWSDMSFTDTGSSDWVVVMTNDGGIRMLKECECVGQPQRSTMSA